MTITHPILRSSTLRRCALMAATLVLGAAVLCHGLILPHVEYRGALRRLEKVTSRMAAELAMVHETLDEKLATLRTLRSDLAELRAGLFPCDESGLFAHDLQILGREVGCTVVAVDLTEEETSRAREDEGPVAVRTFRADVVATGRHEHIVALLEALQERQRRIRVDSYSLEVVDPEREGLAFHGVFTIHAVPPSDPRRDAAPEAENPDPRAMRHRLATGVVGYSAMTIEIPRTIGDCAKPSKENDHVGIVQREEEVRAGEDSYCRR